MTVGESIKKARQKESLSRWKLSKLSNVSEQTIRSWEDDKTSPSINLLTRVADVLEVSLDELVGRKFDSERR